MRVASRVTQRDDAITLLEWKTAPQSGIPKDTLGSSLFVPSRRQADFLASVTHMVQHVNREHRTAPNPGAPGMYSTSAPIANEDLITANPRMQYNRVTSGGHRAKSPVLPPQQLHGVAGSAGDGGLSKAWSGAGDEDDENGLAGFRPSKAVGIVGSAMRGVISYPTTMEVGPTLVGLNRPQKAIIFPFHRPATVLPRSRDPLGKSSAESAWESGISPLQRRSSSKGSSSSEEKGGGTSVRRMTLSGPSTSIISPSPRELATGWGAATELFSSGGALGATQQSLSLDSLLTRAGQCVRLRFSYSQSPPGTSQSSSTKAATTSIPATKQKARCRPDCSTTKRDLAAGLSEGCSRAQASDYAAGSTGNASERLSARAPLSKWQTSRASTDFVSASPACHGVCDGAVTVENVGARNSSSEHSEDGESGDDDDEDSSGSCSDLFRRAKLPYRLASAAGGAHATRASPKAPKHATHGLVERPTTHVDAAGTSSSSARSSHEERLRKEIGCSSFALNTFRLCTILSNFSPRTPASFWNDDYLVEPYAGELCTVPSTAPVAASSLPVMPASRTVPATLALASFSTDPRYGASGSGYYQNYYASTVTQFGGSTANAHGLAEEEQMRRAASQFRLGGGALGTANAPHAREPVVDPEEELENGVRYPMRSYQKTLAPHMSTTNNAAWRNAYFLDSGYITGGERRKKLILLPAFRTSIISFVDKKVLKKDLNNAFFVQHPEMEMRELKVTHLRGLRSDLLIHFVLEESSPLEIMTAAHAMWYFERLAVKGMVGKRNRNLVMACCLMLAIKLLEVGDVSKKITFAKKKSEETLKVPWSKIVETEFKVYVGLDFTLLPERGNNVVITHMERMLQQINVTSQEYFGKKFKLP